MDRLDKVLSSSNISSRSETKRLIREKRITVNGSPALSSDMKISEEDTIEVDGTIVERMHPVVIVMNKPSGYVTSTSDPLNPTVMSLLPERYIKLSVKPVGRLDKDTTGVLLFTNDGALAHRLISPSRDVEKEYLVTHKGKVTPEIIASFKSGLTLPDGEKLKEAELIPIEEGKSRLIIKEGKYHQVKRMMALFGLDVTALERIREGSVELGDLERGCVKELDISLFG